MGIGRTASGTNDVIKVGSETYISDLTDGAELKVMSDRDNWATTNHYSYLSGGRKLPSTMEHSDIVQQVETPVVTYNDVDYSKTISMKVTTYYSHGPDEAALARGQNWDGYNTCYTANDHLQITQCPNQVDFTYVNDLTFDDNLVEGIEGVNGEIDALKIWMQAIQDKLDV